MSNIATQDRENKVGRVESMVNRGEIFKKKKTFFQTFRISVRCKIRNLFQTRRGKSKTIGGWPGRGSACVDGIAHV